MKVRVILFSVLVGAFLSSTMHAQTFTGTIRGIVRDSTGAILPGVTITIRNVATQSTRTVVTDEAGNYNAPFLPPETYEVTAELPGFKKEVRSGVNLEVNQQMALNFVLSVGQMTESITVEAAAIAIETETSSVQKTVDEKKVVELPLNGRNFLELNLLVPGVAPSVKGTQLNTQGGAINANGLREAANFFWLDGMDNTTSIIGQYVIKPPIDTVKEFKVQNASYSSEFGRTAGAQMNVVTKSGTNELHGDVYEFLRNDVFDARNFFDDPKRTKPPFRRNQFGATIGGPIFKDKTFFFASYEGTRNRQQITRTTRVPEPAWIRGDFSNLLPRTIIRDPLTGQPFPGNIIPPNRQDRIGAGLAAFYPAPNLPNAVRNYIALGNQQDTLDAIFGRVDHKFSDRDTFFGRYNFEHQNSVFPINLFATHTVIPGWGRLQNQTFQVFGMSETHVFSPTAINEARAAYNRWPLGYKQQDQGSNVAFDLGIGGLSTNPKDKGFPQVRVTGFENMGSSGNLPQGGPFETYVVADTFSLTRGRHATKVGADYHRFNGNFFLDSTARGLFVFTGQYSGHPAADLILGYPLQAVSGVGSTDLLQTQNSISFFFQDDWKVQPNFTLNLGLRYEYNQPTRERRGRLANFDFQKGIVFWAFDKGPYPPGTINPDKNNFGPRIGFAWDPFKTGKTSIRAGYGVFYDIAIGNVSLNLRINPPLFRIDTAFSDPVRPTIDMRNVFLQPPGQQPPPSVNAQNMNFRDGYVQKWSLNVQHQLMPDILVDVGYMGTKGTHLTWQNNRNQPLPASTALQPRRPYPAFANINMWDSNGDSIYHSFQASVEKRFLHGLSFLGSYTFSRAIDNASTYFGSPNNSNRAQNTYNLRAERGLSDFDVRNRFVFSYNWEIPFGKGRAFLADLSGPANAFLGGWQVNGITTLQSGTPFTPVLSRDNSNTGQFNDRPNLAGNWKLSKPTPERWFNTDAFQIPDRFTFGNSGRDIIIGPHTINFDFSIFKAFRFTEARMMQFRAEFFNLFNTPNFDNPNRTADSPQFGQIFSAGFSRQIQFALKLIF